MNFEWSKEQILFRDSIQSFALEQLCDDVEGRDQRSEFSETLWRRAAEFGIQGMSIPRQYGGKESADIETAVLAMEALGCACPDGGLVLGINAQMWSVQLPILHFGTEWQKEQFLPKFCSGQWKGAHGITEPNAGSDVFNMQTKATAVDGGYVINGEKCLVSLAPICDQVLVFASTRPELGKWGISSFIVDAKSAGVSVGANESKMGLRTIPIGSLNFVDCFVPENRRLGQEGRGFSMFNYSLEFERCCMLAGQVGAMQRQLNAAVAYARKRHQFGQSIGKNQSISNRIADMKLRLETSRLMLYKVAWLKGQGKSAMAEAAMLKLHLSECFLRSSEDALRIHGGHGYLSENGVDRDLRDAWGGVFYAGTSDIQRNIIAGMLGISG